MLGIELLNSIFVWINNALDFIFLWGGLFLFLIIYPTYFFSTNLKKYSKENRGQELVTQAFLAVLIGTGISIVWTIGDVIYFVWLSGPTTPAEAAAAWGDFRGFFHPSDGRFCWPYFLSPRTSGVTNMEKAAGSPQRLDIAQ